MLTHAALLVALLTRTQLGPEVLLTTDAGPALLVVDAAHVGLTNTGGQLVAAWADTRRSDALSAFPGASPFSDVWVRTLRSPQPPSLLCLARAPTLAPDVTFSGRLVIAFRYGATTLGLATASWDGGWENGGCGSVLPTSSSPNDGPILVPRAPTLNRCSGPAANSTA